MADADGVTPLVLLRVVI